jgi:hypothetical protein
VNGAVSRERTTLIIPLVIRGGTRDISTLIILLVFRVGTKGYNVDNNPSCRQGLLRDISTLIILLVFRGVIKEKIT